MVKAKCLTRCTHLDLSGICALDLHNLHDLLIELIDYKFCECLLSIHLNDLGINFDSPIKDEISELFQIKT